MPRLETIVPPAEAVSYLVNLALAVSLVCGIGLLAARACRCGSAPLRHGVLVWTLALILLSPAAVWLAEQSGLALVRGTISGPPITHAAPMSDRMALDVSDAAPVPWPATSAIESAPPIVAVHSERSPAAVPVVKAVAYRESAPPLVLCHG